ncbi:hypothetical protein [Mangrovibacter yixingensis]|uniref:hypothetical protein n=1 Tax=Mangrovibacter yixingensis TaxID=1529639 RepID=UPI001CF97D24|nr:hypothetical protein [Mangrovibacter yixingensis]
MAWAISQAFCSLAPYFTFNAPNCISGWLASTAPVARRVSHTGFSHQPRQAPLHPRRWLAKSPLRGHSAYPGRLFGYRAESASCLNDFDATNPTACMFSAKNKENIPNALFTATPDNTSNPAPAALAGSRKTGEPQKGRQGYSAWTAE